MSVHADLIAGILAANPTAKTRGFMAALRALPDAEYMTGMADHSRWWFTAIAVVPDAYMVDTGSKTVTVFEAVNAHDISNTKFDRISDIAWALDEDRWKLKLVRVDRFGSTVYDPREVFLAQQLSGVKDWQQFQSSMTTADPTIARWTEFLDATLSPGAAA